ncbi:MAG: GNAT family N-acetyltransferase [Rhodanobacteraceae bacterium]
MSVAIRIREASPAEAEALACLSAQLGYPADAEAIVRRLRQIGAHGVGLVLVAEEAGGKIAGTAHVHAEYSMVDEPKAHLADLVVDEASRGRGVGAALLRACEAWARERGLSRMRVNSNVIRERAHRFYLREGYAENKRQAVFFKQLI